jgi:hypothetical protein
MIFDTEEIERAFRHYWETGAVGEDWDAWVDDCFTDDVLYVEHVLGTMEGRETVREWIKPIMVEYGELYTVYEWHQVSDDGRVIVYMQNRRDNPEVAGDPIDFPGITILQYAGDGKFNFEEDFWSFPGAQKTLKDYARAREQHDPDHNAKRTRRDWGAGPDWAHGAATYAESVGAQR